MGHGHVFLVSVSDIFIYCSGFALTVDTSSSSLLDLLDCAEDLLSLKTIVHTLIMPEATFQRLDIAVIGGGIGVSSLTELVYLLY